MAGALMSNVARPSLIHLWWRLRTLREMRAEGTFPIPPIAFLGRHVRFSGQVVRDYLVANGISPRARR